MTIERMKDTQYVLEPIWNETGFSDSDAQILWQRLPDTLKEIAEAEFSAGNRAAQILLNERVDVVVLVFDQKPLSSEPNSSGITVHTSHEYGNYCYDDTLCTYQEKTTGCFLSFNDPNYAEEAI